MKKQKRNRIITARINEETWKKARLLAKKKNVSFSQWINDLILRQTDKKNN